MCWEDYESGIDYNLACSTVNLSNLNVNSVFGRPTYEIAIGQGDQINVDTYKAENGNYMIVWEDSRNNSDENLQTHTDIYYQEINTQGEYIYGDNGIAVCDSYHIQTEPKISLYAKSDSQQSYVIYWTDLRSTGKDLLYNIYAQSISHEHQLSVEDSYPVELSLNSVYPNPFNPEVNINFYNPLSEKISVNIYDLNGKLIETLYNNQLNRGSYTFKWNAQKFSSGIYVVRLKSSNSVISSKISLMK